MKLSVVIVNYNVKYFLEQCLSSVERAISGIDAEVFVVDNASGDGSVEYLRQRFTNVKFIASDKNLGFACANNVAIKESKGEYVLLLNPDTIVAENTFADFIQFMDGHADAGACGAYMLRINGSFALESRRGLPTPFVAFCKMSGLSSLFPKSHLFGKYYMRYLNERESNQIEIMSGAYMFLRKKVIEEVGLLDEDFFMYGEDIDTMSIGNRMILLDISHNVRPRGRKRGNMPKAWPSLVNGMATGNVEKVRRNTNSGSTRRQNMRNDLVFQNTITPTTVTNK